MGVEGAHRQVEHKVIIFRGEAEIDLVEGYHPGIT
jgi:hypothetical protein